MLSRLASLCSCLCSCGLLCGLPASAALAQSDQEIVRGAVARGEIERLSEMLPGLRARHRARLMEIRVLRMQDGYRFEVALLDPEGRLILVEVDPATGREIAPSGAVDSARPRQAGDPETSGGRRQIESRGQSQGQGQGRRRRD